MPVFMATPFGSVRALPCFAFHGRPVGGFAAFRTVRFAFMQYTACSNTICVPFEVEEDKRITVCLGAENGKRGSVNISAAAEKAA
jgi:hypothetical protein